MGTRGGRDRFLRGRKTYTYDLFFLFYNLQSDNIRLLNYPRQVMFQSIFSNLNEFDIDVRKISTVDIKFYRVL